MALHFFFVALLDAVSIVSGGSGETGSRTAGPPSPSNLDRSSKAKRAHPPPPAVDAASDAVAGPAWPTPSRFLNLAFITS